MLEKIRTSSLVRIPAFCDRFNLHNLFVKDESKNPYGTWKDRRSEMIISGASTKSIDKLCLITSGNAGYSLAKYAQKTDIKIVPIVDVNLPASIKQSLKYVCEKTIELDLQEKILTTEEIVFSARENNQEIIKDVTNGFEEAYATIIEEIKFNNPDYIFCPIGSGEGFVGLFGGIQKAKLKTKLIGVRPNTNISFADKLNRPWSPYDKAIESILKLGTHDVIRLSEEEIRSAFEFAKNFINCEPSSSIAIGALSKFQFKKNENIIIINSGKGLT